MNREELEERQLEIANRMKNIIWTVCGDYTLEAKPDVEAFLKSKYIALYDGIKQGAFAKYFEKENFEEDKVVEQSQDSDNLDMYEEEKIKHKKRSKGKRFK